MKKIFNFIALAASAITIGVSCQKNELSEKPSVSGEMVHFIVRTGETKTFIDYDSSTGKYTPKWNKGDALGMIFSVEETSSALGGTLYNTADDGVEGVFKGEVTAPATEGKFYSFVPASSFYQVYADKTIGCEVGDADDNYKQHPKRATVDPDADLLFAAPCDYLASGSDVEIDDLRFARIMSILKINLKGSYIAGDVVSSIKITTPGASLSLTGRAKIDPKTVTISQWIVRKPWVWAEYEEDEEPVAGTDAIYLLVNPQTIAKDSTLVITGETDNNSINKSIKLTSDFVLKQGYVTNLNLTINEADCTKKVKVGYKLQTTSGAFEVGGKYIFAFKDGGDGGHYYFLDNSGTSGQLACDALAVDKSNMITTSETKYVWEAEAGSEDGQYLFKNGSDSNYIYCSGSSTTLDTSNDDATGWTPEYLSASKTYKLLATRYIGAGSTTNVKAYVTSNFKDQIDEKINVTQYAGAISVFKYEDGRPQLATPTGLAVNGFVVSWNADSNAASYQVAINGTETNVTTNSYTYLGVDGYYDVSVYAIPTNPAAYKNSDAATLEKAKFGDPTLATPELKEGGVTASSITVTWTADAQATEGYLCQLYNGETYVSEQTVNAGSVTFTGLTNGVTYTIKVNAKAVEGAQAWKASSVASISIEAKDTQIKDITAAGTYTVSNVTVYAVSGSTAILGDTTGKIVLYKSGHGLAVGDQVTITGNVIKYNGVWEFNSATFTDKTSGSAPDHGTPVESTAIPSSYTSSPTITYVHATGTQGSGDNARIITTSGTPSWSFYLSDTNTDTVGCDVDTYGYVYGYYESSSTISYLATSLDFDGIQTTASNVTLGATAGSTAKVTVKAGSNWTANTSANSHWTVSPSSGEAGSTEVTITATNAGGTSETTLDNLVFTLTGTEQTATVTVKQASSSATTSVIDFEKESSTYTDWTFTSMTSQVTGTIKAHGGTYYGTTGGKATASIVTKAAIVSPKSITFHVSKTTNNTTSSNWKIQTSSDNKTWTDVKTQSATSMAKGTWVEVTQDLSSYSNVYVRVYYSGSTALRTIDDLTLTY